MIKINFDKDCYSCGVCVNTCPVDAIHMIENDKGFLQANIDKSLCVDCGVCEKKCVAMEKKIKSSIKPINSYYGYNKNVDIRMHSSSGGYFYQLAETAISQGYVVGGCIWDDNFQPVHILTDKIKEVYLMMGSKYVQSNTTNIMYEIKHKLQDGQKVLFSGVPCQINALKKYCGEQPGLITIAIVCHGVISRGVWRKYLSEIQKKYGKIKTITMRNKDRGWSDYGLKFTFLNGRELTLYRKSDGYFLKRFTEGLFERERCLNCEMKNGNINADILLGDGWGKNQFTTKLDDGKGISGVIVLSEIGKKLIDNIDNQFENIQVSSHVLLDANPRITTAAPKNRLTNSFYLDYIAQKSISQLIIKYEIKQPCAVKAWNKIKAMFKRKV